MTRTKKLIAKRRGVTLEKIIDSKGKVVHYLVDGHAITNYREALARFKHLVNPRRYGNA